VRRLLRALFRRRPLPVELRMDWGLYWDTKAEYERQIKGAHPTTADIQAWNNRPLGDHAAGKWFEY
jgi:hypothetical protein